MPVIYRFSKVYRKRQSARLELSSLGAALALARHDLEYSQRPAIVPVSITDGTVLYSYTDICRLTALDARGGILVRLPL